MEKIRVQKINNIDLQLDCNAGIAMELAEYFSFFVPGYKFMPPYKNGVWDGKIRLFNRESYKLPVGLYPHLVGFTKNYGYEVDLIEGPIGYPTDQNEITAEELYSFIQTLNLHTNGSPITIRDYQFAAVLRAIRTKRTVLLSPTSSGKSLIIYVIMRWFLSQSENKAIIIVPTTQLVEQMFNDFADYSSHDKSFDSKTMCHMIYSGKPKTNIPQKIFISTWQSIYKFPSTWFDAFGLIVGDECHNFKAKALSSIMNKSYNAEYRFGTTGTLDGTQVHKLVLEGLFGKVYDVTTTKKLQDSGTIAPLEISRIVLQHPDSVRKSWGKRTYQEEVDYLVRNESRNRVIRKLALDLDGNTLVLYQFVKKHGKVLYEEICKHAGPDRKIYFVSGEVSTVDREEIRKIVEKEKNAIIVASMGTFSTGVNIRNLHNLIFASPSKSQILVLQSIGRGLRKSDDGRTTRLFDFVDDLTVTKNKNFTYTHGQVRLSIYRAQQFKIETYKVTLHE